MAHDDFAISIGLLPVPIEHLISFNMRSVSFLAFRSKEYKLKSDVKVQLKRRSDFSLLMKKLMLFVKMRRWQSFFNILLLMMELYAVKCILYSCKFE